MKFAIVIPTLNPDKKMTDFVDTLVAAGYKDIVLVNDGSSAETVKYFELAKEHPEVVVLTHEVNKGKGAGLKTAFKYLLENRPDIDAAITADADGQHDVVSLKKCADAYEDAPGSVIFGGRDFSKQNVPIRSFLGNKISSVVYRLFIGIKLVDTQTGLRVVPKECFGEFSELTGDRYEYETNMIIAVKQKNIPYKEVSIETIYIDGNESSHFNTVKDSARIYSLVLGHFFKFMGSSILCWGIDMAIYAIVIAICCSVWNLKESACDSISLVNALINQTWDLHISSVLIATIASRVVSSIVNFIINKKIVFKNRGNVGKTAGKYFVLALCQLFISFLLVDFLTNEVFHVTGALNVIIKCVVDGCLFFLSYSIQRKWVFKNSKK